MTGDDQMLYRGLDPSRLDSDPRAEVDLLRTAAREADTTRLALAAVDWICQYRAERRRQPPDFRALAAIRQAMFDAADEAQESRRETQRTP